MRRRGARNRGLRQLHGVGSPRHSCNRKPRRSFRQRHHRKLHQGRPRARLLPGYAHRPDSGPPQPPGLPLHPRSPPNGPPVRRPNRPNAHQRRLTPNYARLQRRPSSGGKYANPRCPNRHYAAPTVTPLANRHPTAATVIPDCLSPSFRRKPESTPCP